MPPPESEREELQKLLRAGMAHADPYYDAKQYIRDTADAILAAGYRKRADELKPGDVFTIPVRYREEPPR